MSLESRVIDPGRIEVIDDATVAVLRAMTPSQRVERGLRMGAFARTAIEAGVRRARPDWDAKRVAEEVKRRFAGG